MLLGGRRRRHHHQLLAALQQRIAPELAARVDAAARYDVQHRHLDLVELVARRTLPPIRAVERVLEEFLDLVGRRQPALDGPGPLELLDRVDPPFRHEARLEQATGMAHVAVEIAAGVIGNDAAQMRRPLGRTPDAIHREMAVADHREIAVAPVLLRDPLDQIVHIRLLDRGHVLVLALALPGPALRRDHVDIAVVDQHVGRARLDRVRQQRRRELQFLGVGRDRQHRRHRTARALGTIDVGRQQDAVAHRNADVGDEFGVGGQLAPRRRPQLVLRRLIQLLIDRHHLAFG